MSLPYHIDHFIVLFIVIIQNSQTPLHVASQEGHYSMVDYLIASGADINAVGYVSCITLSISILMIFII